MGSLKASAVNQIIARYESERGLDLITLMDMARVLVCQAYWYADALGELNKAYQMAYVRRKAFFAESVQKMRIDGKSAAAAKAEAEGGKEYADLLAAEVELEGRKAHGRLMYDAIQNVVARMNQEIAELRQEKSYQNFLPGA